MMGGGDILMSLAGARLRCRGLTLIELMISIAILAIFLAIPVTGLQGLKSLSREDDYRWALANARGQKEWLLSVDFDQLPPEQLTVSRDGFIQLSQDEVIGETITVDGRPLPNLSLEKRRLFLGKDRAGQKVTVNYEFSLPDHNEAHFLDEARQVTLQNSPVQKLEAVWLAQGDRLVPTQAGSSDLASGRLSFPELSPGTLVVIDYRGDRWGNRLSGQFLDDSFQPTGTPSNIKLFEVKEWYGGGWRLTLPLVKVRS